MAERMATIKESDNNKYWPGWGEKGTQFLPHWWWEQGIEISIMEISQRTTIRNSNYP